MPLLTFISFCSWFYFFQSIILLSLTTFYMALDIRITCLSLKSSEAILNHNILLPLQVNLVSLSRMLISLKTLAMISSLSLSHLVLSSYANYYK